MGCDFSLEFSIVIITTKDFGFSGRRNICLLPPLLPQQPHDVGSMNLIWYQNIGVSGTSLSSGTKLGKGRVWSRNHYRREQEEGGGCRLPSKVPWGSLRQTALLSVKPGEGQQVVRLWRHVQLSASPLPPSLTPLFEAESRLQPRRTLPFPAKFLPGPVPGKEHTSIQWRSCGNSCRKVSCITHGIWGRWGGSGYWGPGEMILALGWKGWHELTHCWSFKCPLIGSHTFTDHPSHTWHGSRC